MKKLLLLFFAFVICGCSSDNDSTSGGSGDGTGGSLAVFALRGNYLYTVDHKNLNVFSISNQSQPVKVNEKNVGFNIETLFAHGNNLYIGSRNGMFIYSLTDPQNPVQLAEVQHFASCDPVVANDTHSFVTLSSNNFCNGVNRLQIYNTTNPSQPVLVYEQGMIQPKGLGLYHNYLFVCDEVIKVFDVSNPAAPIVVHSIDKQCHDVIIIDDTMYAIGETAMYRYQLDQANIINTILLSEVIF